jgi:hypothetical protein
MRKSNSDPIGTLSVGNVVSTGVTLYKSNFQSYFFVSLRAVGWVVLAMLAIVPILFVTNIVSYVIGTGLSVLLTILLWFGAFLYCFSKFTVNRAIISRMAYQQLINQPETLQVATQRLASSNWKFLALAMWLGLFVFGVIILAYLFLLSCLLLGTFLTSQIPGAVGALLAIGLTLLGIIGFLLIIIRFYSAWFVAELPLAVEGQMGALDSIGRSRQLSTPFISRILMVILVSFLVTLPLIALSNAPSLASYGELMSQIQRISAGDIRAASSPLSSTYYLLQALSVILSLLLELMAVPFWQSIKSVIYFDLRSRREGNDLQLR